MNNLDLEVIIQNNSLSDYIPSIKKISSWLGHIPDRMIDKYVTIRIVDELESKDINLRYRKIDRATNVLAFPNNTELNISEQSKHIGDIILCYNVVRQEAKKRNISFSDHMIHLILHGVLHLCGYDHIKKSDEVNMIKYEKLVLNGVGIKDPYVCYN